jgi:hypothetical protein
MTKARYKISPTFAAGMGADTSSYDNNKYAFNILLRFSQTQRDHNERKEVEIASVRNFG